MASLVGQQLKDTYDSLLKTSDNDALGGTYKEITDGAGNGSNLYLGTGGRVGIGASPNALFDVTSGVGSTELTGHQIFLTRNGNNEIYAQGASSVLALGANSLEKMRIDSSGDISFRDGSANEAFYWDASAGSLGIGTTSPVAPLDVDANSSATNLNLRSRTGSDFSNLNFSTDDGATILANIGSVGDSLRISTGGLTSLTERMRIDSSGNVGINNTSPSSFLSNGRELVLGNGSASHGMTIFSDSAGTGNLFFADGTTGDEAYRGFLRYNHADDAMVIFTAGANERMRIDSSGNLLVGKTDTTRADVGAVLSSTGNRMTADGNEALELIRNTDDGDILQFFRTNTLVGSIGSVGSAVSYIILDPRSSMKGAGILGSSIDANTGIIQPVDKAGAVADNAINLGGSSNRWKNLYLGGNVILSSGQGIDFSATADATGMTSELLDDYEEGTWSPEYTSSVGAFATMTMDVLSATYTKVGRQVTVRAYFRTDDVDTAGSPTPASGVLRVSGLPFTASGDSAISVGYVFDWGTAPDSGYVVDGQSYIFLRKTNATLDSDVSDLASPDGADKNRIILTATYFV